MTFSDAVQGFVGSSDELITATDVALAGLQIKKMMDDILIEAVNIKELVEKSRALFERCRERKLFFSRSKVQCGSEVTYGGMSLSRKAVYLSKQRLEQVARMVAPTNVGELRSFLRTINFIRGYLPDLTQLCSNLLPLLKQKVVKEYVWTAGCQDDFIKIKEALTAGTILGIFDPEWETSLWIDFFKDRIRIGTDSGAPQGQKDEKVNLVLIT